MPAAASTVVSGERENDKAQATPATPATINLPKGGGAIQGIGEKFAANPVTGTAAITIPLGLTGGRAGFNPDLALAYNSGAGNGLFGIGWQLNLASIQRKTSKGLPLYQVFNCGV